ncbi:hypothetical protein F4827_002539 [Paraburkholderia bannensis]|uniref:Uncharacterized protein n=1 Tax=Paraburkholderia bannensis TaxID=765414 RepID=A0A7W9WSU6_9BURK|nr:MULTISPECIES: hypothetical protein [Paraburkholderia]MBB3257674.1 hypothetical protein [Paraburkholderia sp. WP4_3_2]MBB6102687.1 hypothetical protein [Paraburkholderia bannensis]
MIIHDDEHVSVRISSAGLSRARGDNELLKLADIRRVERLYKRAAIVLTVVVGVMYGYSIVFGS